MSNNQGNLVFQVEHLRPFFQLTGGDPPGDTIPVQVASVKLGQEEQQAARQYLLQGLALPGKSVIQFRPLKKEQNSLTCIVKSKKVQ